MYSTSHESNRIPLRPIAARGGVFPVMTLRIVPFLILVFLLHSGAIRRERDIILETQTDPISLKKKIEELKDGEKGPTTPTFEFYEGRDFQTKVPVDNNPEAAGIPQVHDHIPQYGDQVPENLEGIEQEKQGEDDWWTESWGGETEPPKDAKTAQWEEKW